MTDEEALIAAVRATPDDDLPRLVYADWLDERGRHEQAAFIRLSANPRHVDRRTRENKRWQELRLLLIDEFAQQYPGVRWRWADHGVFLTLLADAQSWVRHGDAICAAHPVRRVELTTTILLRGKGVKIGINGDPKELLFSSAELIRDPRYDGTLGPALVNRRWPSVVEWTLISQPDTPVQALWRGMTGRDEVGEVIETAQPRERRAGERMSREREERLPQVTLRPHRQPHRPDDR